MEKHSIALSVKAISVACFNHEGLAQLCNFLHKKQHQAVLRADVSGIVLQCGNNCTTVEPGDHVVGSTILSADDVKPVINIDECDIVIKPPDVSWVDGAACIGDGVAALQAVLQLGKTANGSRILVTNGASPVGSACLQVAVDAGAKVWTTYKNTEEKQRIEKLGINIKTVDVSGSALQDLSIELLRDTGHLGLDVIIDNCGASYDLREAVDQKDRISEMQHYVNSLGLGGCWVTSQTDIQLDPPMSALMYLRSAQLAFWNPSVYTMARRSQGKYLHLMQSVVDRLASGKLTANIDNTETWSDDRMLVSQRETNLGTVVYTLN